MSQLMTRAQFSRMAPRAELAVIFKWPPPLTENFTRSAIITDPRQAAIMASCLNESGGFTVFEEATYFNTPWARIRQIFAGVIGLTAELVESWRRLGRQGFDEAFFNHVYADANRGPGYRLGNIHPGDGYRFRGLGPNQLTGRGNYTWMEKEVGLPLVENPESLLLPEVGAQISCHFWRKHGLNEAVDDGSESGFLYAMRRMNAGLSDFSHHLGYWAVTKAVMANDEISERGFPEPLPTGQLKADVIDLQTRLVGKGYDTRGIDGMVGPGTTAAIKGFEIAVDLRSDGLVDPDMLEALRHQFLGLRAGARNAAAVKVVQGKLLEAGFDLGPTRDDGDFGGRTEAGLRTLQERAGKRPTGYVDRPTAELLKLAA